ncbi:MAG: Uma2 family endonuclease [Candidatus Parabeggiatoa sp.]|nr:Uma2 family endonuclease [Candidatus Parabeggiatoa sp.]
MPIAAKQSEISSIPDFQGETTINYPETDGQPMADSDAQRKPLTYLIEALDYHFHKQSQVYVSGDLLIYYEKGNPKASVAPDVFVVFCVPKHPRKTYKTWIEGKAPDVVIEIASHRTFYKDEKVKPQLYQRLGVQEYFQFDPTGEFMQPVLCGRYLDQNSQYQQMNVEQLKEDRLMLNSRVLGLEFHVEKDELRVFDPKSKAYLLTYSEAVEACQLAEATLDRQKWALDALFEWERAEKERERADKLAERLRALGINPDDI